MQEIREEVYELCADIVVHMTGDRFNDAQRVTLGRVFIVAIVAVTYLLSLFPPPHVFDLAVWCFSGFASLFPLVVAAVYWRRATAAPAAEETHRTPADARRPRCSSW